MVEPRISGRYCMPVSGSIERPIGQAMPGLHTGSRVPPEFLRSATRPPPCGCEKQSDRSRHQENDQPPGSKTTTAASTTNVFQRNFVRCVHEIDPLPQFFRTVRSFWFAARIRGSLRVRNRKGFKPVPPLTMIAPKAGGTFLAKLLLWFLPRRFRSTGEHGEA